MQPQVDSGRMWLDSMNRIGESAILGVYGWRFPSKNGKSDAKMDDFGLPLETTRLWYIITMNSWNMKKHPWGPSASHQQLVSWWRTPCLAGYWRWLTSNIISVYDVRHNFRPTSSNNKPVILPLPTIRCSEGKHDLDHVHVVTYWWVVLH